MSGLFYKQGEKKQDEVMELSPIFDAGVGEGMVKQLV